jgi:hypothetical protein
VAHLPQVVAVAAVAHMVGRRRAGLNTDRSITKAIAVPVEIPGRNIHRGIVHRSVAVIVLAVTHLVRPRVAHLPQIVAVTAVAHMVGRLGAGLNADRSITKAIAVAVKIPGHNIHRGIVHHGVAVVVLAVTHLVRSRVALGAQIIAVVRVAHMAWRCRASKHREGLTARSIAVGVVVPGDRLHRLVVDEPIAILVDAIAVFDRPGKPIRVVIGAVAARGAEVPVGIGEAARPVTVVVAGVGAVGLRCTRVKARVGIVAVTTDRDVALGHHAGGHRRLIVAGAVAVTVDKKDLPHRLVGELVTVVVAAVADLRGPGMRELIAIIAVVVHIPIAVEVLGDSRGATGHQQQRQQGRKDLHLS